MEDLLTTFSNQISQTINNQLAQSDVSMNELDNRGINIEYVFQTPDNMFTLRSNSTSSLGDMVRNMNSNTNNTNDTNDTNNTNNTNNTSSDTSSDT